MSGPAGPTLTPSQVLELAASNKFLHLPRWIFDAVWTPYVYTTGIGPAALGALAAALAFPVQIESNTHFVLTKQTALVTDQAVPPTTIYPVPFITCSLAQSGSARGFMPAAQSVPLVNIFGTGQRPFEWDVAKLIEANSQFAITLNNLVAVAYNVYLSFIGFAVVVSG